VDIDSHYCSIIRKLFTAKTICGRELEVIAAQAERNLFPRTNHLRKINHSYLISEHRIKLVPLEP
jgi:hypothetical protein